MERRYVKYAGLLRLSSTRASWEHVEGRPGCTQTCDNCQTPTKRRCGGLPCLLATRRQGALEYQTLRECWRPAKPWHVCCALLQAISTPLHFRQSGTSGCTAPAPSRPHQRTLHGGSTSGSCFGSGWQHWTRQMRHGGSRRPPLGAAARAEAAQRSSCRAAALAAGGLGSRFDDKDLALQIPFLSCYSTSAPLLLFVLAINISA